MRTLWTCVVAALALGGCGGGNDDKAACAALRDAGGDNAAIYAELREMDLSDELQTALDGLEQAGEEISPEVFARGAEVMAICEEEGVQLSG